MIYPQLSANKFNFDQATNVFNISKYSIQIHSIIQGFRGVYYVMLKILCDDVTESLGDKISRNLYYCNECHSYSK